MGEGFIFALKGIKDRPIEGGVSLFKRKTRQTH
jgi:hypothetical protein